MLQADQLQKIEDFFKANPESLLWRGDAAEFVSTPTPLTQSIVIDTLNSPQTWKAAAQLLNYPLSLDFDQPYIQILLSHSFVDLSTEAQMFEYDNKGWQCTDAYTKPSVKISWFYSLLRPRLLLWQANIFQPSHSIQLIQKLVAFEKTFFDVINSKEPESSIEQLLKQIKTGMSFILAVSLIDGMYEQYVSTFKVKYGSQQWNEIETYIAQLVKVDDEYFHSIQELSSIKDDEAKLNQYLQKFGNRAFDDYELSSPRFHENPTKIQQLSKTAAMDSTQIQPHNPPIFLNSKDLEIAKIASQIKALRGTFRVHVLILINQARQWALQKAKQLNISDNGIFFYTKEELQDFQQLNVEVIARRKAEYERDLMIHLPLLLTADSWNESLHNLTEKPLNSDVFKVLPVSNGEASGRVMYIHSDTQQAPPKGSVLIIPNSSAQYSHFYAGAAAIIFCQGGIMSHGAIVSREYHIPAVSLSGRSFDVKEGEIVTVSTQHSSIFRDK